MAAGESAKVMESKIVRRVAVSSMARLDDKLEGALELDRVRNNGVICVVGARLLLPNGEV